MKDHRPPTRKPRYQQMGEDILVAIRDGRLRANEQLPTEFELARQHQVHRGTVRRVYQWLKDRGMIEQVRGRGTFVRGDAPQRLGVPPQRMIRKVAWVGYRQVLAIYEYVYSDLLAGVSEACRKRGMELVSIPLSSETGPLSEAFQQELEEVDGVIFVGQEKDDRLVKWLCERGKPSVGVWEDTWGSMLPLVSYDRLRAGELAAQHLAACGVARVAFMGNTALLVGRRKLEGFRASVEKRGMTLKPAWLARCSPLPGGTYGAMRRLIDSGDLPQAVYAESDYRAIEAIQALHDAGLSVPEDVAVIGHGDIDELSQQVSLTTIRTPRVECGRQAVELLLREPQETDAPERVMLEPELIVRSSTRPLSARTQAAGKENAAT